MGEKTEVFKVEKNSKKWWSQTFYLNKALGNHWRVGTWLFEVKIRNTLEKKNPLLLLENNLTVVPLKEGVFTALLWKCKQNVADFTQNSRLKSLYHGPFVIK